MNLEGITIASLTKELQKNLLGSIIYKISMPTPQALLLQLRREKDTVALLADMNSKAPALYLPAKLPANPETPPAFCMLLRKHLEEGRINKITQWGLDRILTLEIDLLGKNSQIITKKLIFELTGKNANIIFAQNGKIIDSLKHISRRVNSYRTIMPGDKYLPPPPQKGYPVLSTAANTAVDLDALVTSLPDIVERKCLNSFIATTTGIGKVSAAQIFTKAGIPLEATYLAPPDRKHLKQALQDLQKYFTAGQSFSVLISAANCCQTILPYPAQPLAPHSRVQNFTDLNQALLYALDLEPIQLPEHDDLAKIVAAEKQKQQKKSRALQEDLAQAEKADIQRIKADTLMANIYHLHQGQLQCVLPSIYDGEELTIALNPVLNPAANAQRYYKRYNKYKRAQEELQKQLQETLGSLKYLDSLDSSLLTAVDRGDIQEIREEMIQAGLIAKAGKKRQAPSKSAPLQFTFSPETKIFIGKNNKQNDQLTFKMGSSQDHWFHVKDLPGSHVLLKTSLPRPEAAALTAAASLAAYFSKGRSGHKVPVDCTLKKYVKKPAGSKPGFVIYTHQKTFYADPDSEQIQKWLQRKA